MGAADHLLPLGCYFFLHFLSLFFFFVYPTKYRHGGPGGPLPYDPVCPIIPLIAARSPFLWRLDHDSRNLRTRMKTVIAQHIALSVWKKGEKWASNHESLLEMERNTKYWPAERKEKISRDIERKESVYTKTRLVRVRYSEIPLVRISGDLKILFAKKSFFAI